MQLFSRDENVETGLIAAVLGLIGTLVVNRDHIRTAILATRIKEGSEIRLMTKQVVELSGICCNKDVELSAAKIENNELRERLRRYEDGQKI